MQFIYVMWKFFPLLYFCGLEFYVGISSCKLSFVASRKTYNYGIIRLILLFQLGFFFLNIIGRSAGWGFVLTTHRNPHICGEKDNEEYTQERFLV